MGGSLIGTSGGRGQAACVRHHATVAQSHRPLDQFVLFQQEDKRTSR